MLSIGFSDTIKVGRGGRVRREEVEATVGKSLDIPEDEKDESDEHTHL